ncbi:MAG: radical SAM protein [bacterium]|nr:radical SAM protein [bacterium]
MKILFIRPDSDVQSVYPPVGLLHIAAYLRTQSDQYEFKVIDSRNTCETPQQLADIAYEFQPDVIGITSLSSECKFAVKAAQVIGARVPNIPIVMGGAHVTSDPTWFLKYPEIDYCVAGEGEEIFYKFTQLLPELLHEELDKIPGVYYRQADGAIKGTPHDYIQDLEQIPMPAWDLLDITKYFNNKRKRPSTNPHNWDPHCLPMMTSRGCPFHCAYCHDIFGIKVRTWSLEHVMAEFDYLTTTLGAKEVEIMDDLFNANLKRASEILNLMAERKRGTHLALINGLRADNLSDEFLHACKKAGIYRILFAIESASPRVQKLIRKNLNLDKAFENIAKAAALRFSTGGYFMLGFPEETLEEMHLTLEWAVKSDLHTATFLLLCPFPNTDMYKWAVEHGYDMGDQVYEDYYRIRTNLTKVSTEEIEHLRAVLFRRFYMNPKRIYRYLRDTPFHTMLWKKITAAIRMTVFGDLDSGKKKFW